MQRVILTTGGTGGHIFPALAVAEQLREEYPGIRLLFVGGTRGPEEELAIKAGLEFEKLPIKPMLGRGLKAYTSIFWMGASLIKAFVILRKFKPDAVLGFGGYAAFASVLAACITGVPAEIHEQNSVPGLTNRVLGKLVKKVCLSFPDDNNKFAKVKVVVTGNPVRKAIIALGSKNHDVPSATRAKRLLIIGGSQGAVAINTAILKALPELTQAGIEIRHQAGTYDLERVLGEYKKIGVDAKNVSPFIHDMAQAYEWADLLVCRAGASTIAELTVAGKVAIFIPFPHATHNHQVANARFMEKKGAALCLEQKEFESKSLAEMILDLINNGDKLAQMAMAAKTQGHADAAKEVVRELKSIVG